MFDILFNHIRIETGNRKESESIGRIRIGIDKIQMIPNPICDHVSLSHTRTHTQTQTRRYSCDSLSLTHTQYEQNSAFEQLITNN